MSLTPILIAGSGRSGTTALMAQLGVEPRIAFDRSYPFENRYLTYLAKFALLAGRPSNPSSFSSDALHNFKNPTFGAPPWPTEPPPPGGALSPTAAQWMRGAWSGFVAAVGERQPDATHYAEKAPHWLAAAIRPVVPARVVYLVRDPRDVFLSANAFNRRRGWLAFGREAGDSDRDYALKMAYAWIQFFENQREDRARPDTLTVRFEDFVGDRAAAVGRLSAFLELPLVSDPDAGAEFLPIHQTSDSISGTVGRWRRERIAPDARSLLESVLYEAMAFNDYPATTPPLDALALDQATTTSPDGRLMRTSADALEAEITGNDFWVEMPGGGRAANETAEFWACVRADVGAHCSLYWRRANESYDESRSVHTWFFPGNHWQIVRFNPAAHEHWHGRMTGLRFDLANGSPKQGRAEVRWIRCIPAA